MIELTFKGNNLEEVFAAMREALKGAKPKKVEPVKEEHVEEKPIEKVEVSEVKDFTLTMNDIKRLTKAKLEEGKSAQVKELLADFEVGKVSQLVEDQFISFSERLEEL